MDCRISRLPITFGACNVGWKSTLGSICGFVFFRLERLSHHEKFGDFLGQDEERKEAPPSMGIEFLCATFGENNSADGFGLDVFAHFFP